MELNTTRNGIGITTPLDEDGFIKNAQSYIDAIITNLEDRFPEIRTLTLGYFDPRNVIQQQPTTAAGATPLIMQEIGEKLQIDGHKLWQEGYKSFAESLPQPLSVEVAVGIMHAPQNKEAMTVAYPLISNILARIAVLVYGMRRK